MSHSRMESFKEKDFASTADREELAIKYGMTRLGAFLMLMSAGVSLTLVYVIVTSLT